MGIRFCKRESITASHLPLFLQYSEQRYVLHNSPPYMESHMQRGPSAVKWHFPIMHFNSQRSVGFGLGMHSIWNVKNGVQDE